jgi:hypothetical protein
MTAGVVAMLLSTSGFEFSRDAQGRVTHVIVRGAAGAQKAVRKTVPGRAQ